MRDESVTTKLAAQLESVLPAAVKQMGIELTMERVFIKDTFLVFRLAVVEHDTLRLLTVVKGEAFAESFAELVGCLERMDLKDELHQLESKIWRKIHDALLLKLAERIPEKLEENGIHVELAVLDSKTQADHFFETLSSLNAAS